jgi:AraC family transcriptional activator of pobA
MTGQRLSIVAHKKTLAPDRPSPSLYRQPTLVDDFEFIHIETIRDRAQRHDWVIEPHRHSNLFQMIVLIDGEIEANIDGDTHFVGGPHAILIPPLTIHGFKLDINSEGYVFTLADAYLRSLLPARWMRECYGLIDMANIIELNTDQESEQYPLLLKNLIQEQQCKEFGRSLIVESYIRILFAKLGRHQDTIKQAIGMHDTQVDIYYRYRDLINKNYKEHWTLNQYAAALFVTEKQLNEICKRMLNQTAHQLIQGRQTMEARRLLLYTLSTIEQISYELGFQDPAYFSRFFKKQCGQPPSQFRNQYKKE